MYLESHSDVNPRSPWIVQRYITTQKSFERTSSGRTRGVIPYSKTNRAIRHVRLPIGRERGVFRQVAICRKRLWEIVLNVCRRVVQAVAVEHGDDGSGYVVQEDEVDGIGCGYGAVLWEGCVGLEEVGIAVVCDFRMGRVVAVGAEVVACGVAGSQRCGLTTHDAAQRA